MTLFLLLLIFFLVSEVTVQKGLMPKFIKKLSAGKLILFSLLTIFLIAVFSFFVRQAVILVILSTIYLSIVISKYYMNGFSKMERGKKI